MIFFITLIISLLFLEPNFSLEIQNKNIWRFHFNLEDIKESILYDSKIYCFAERGYFYLDLESNNIIKNTVDLNLSGVDVIKALDYNGELVLIYSSGKIDFVRGNRVSSVDLAITENVKINHVTNKEKYIYVSSTEGVYVIDAENKTVKERYEYFYDPNDKVNVSFLNFSKNKIYVISDDDIFFSDINSNYKDFRNWDKLSLFNDSIYGSFIENDQLYFYNNSSIFSEIGVSVGTDVDGEIVLIKEMDNMIYKLFKRNQSMFLIVKDEFNDTTSLNIPKNLKVNNFDIYDNDMWLVGDAFSLYNVDENIFYSPSNFPVKSINKIYDEDNIIYTFSGGDKFSVHNQGLWESENLNGFDSISSIAKNSLNTFYASFSHGILDYNNFIIIDDNYPGSLLKKYSNSSDIVVTDIEYIQDVLWILNYGSNTPLISREINNNWQSYEIGIGFNYPLSLTFNGSETLWVIHDKSKFGGITLFNTLSKEKFNLSITNNKLKSTNVNAIAIDQNDYVWVGSDEGLIYFTTSKFDDIKNYDNYLTPNNGERNIFQNIKINDILVDFSNKKWIATNQGIFVFNSENKTIESIKTDNSPLQSNNVLSINMDKQGDIFILTDYGLISYKTYNESPNLDYSKLKIFPNPVDLDVDQNVKITGLVDNNLIHITNQSGRLILSEIYKGGGFLWNLKDSKNIKVNSGIYFVFITSNDGSRELVEKIFIK